MKANVLEFSGDERATFMSKVYGWMTGGLLLTAGVSLAMVMSGAAAALVANAPLFYGLLFAELALVFAYSFFQTKLGFEGSLAVLAGYAALNGVTFSAVFVLYGLGLAAQAFAITATMFAGLSIFGYFTKKDMSGWGTFLFMGLIGLLVVMIIEMFVASTLMSFLVSCAAVLLFSAMTAYDTQKIKNMMGDDASALNGALTLYLDFINLFIHILRLLALRDGGSRD